MNNDMQLFTNDIFGSSRFIREGDSFVVVAKDVVKAVGNAWNGAPAVAHVPEQWRLVRSVLTSNGTKDVICLTEQGLYFYLGRCDKPAALQYQMWIAGEVVPNLRKHGAYMTGDILSQIKANPRALGELLLNLANEQEKREELEEREEIWGTRTPWGEVSRRTGRPRTHIVHGYPRSSCRDPEYIVTTTVTKTQLRLFNPYEQE